MIKLSLAEIKDVLHAKVLNEKPVEITNTTFDSRKATSGSLFVPLVADHDGHNYIQAAVAEGAIATLWQSDHLAQAPKNVPTIIVSDTLVAYQTLAAYYLTKVAPKVVAISGSNGKTTTKDLVAAIGATTYKTFKTPANFNNEIGVPKTILSMPTDTELLVIEFGMDRPGDLTHLSELVHPDITVLTMIGEAHIEFFKTRAHIADGKMEIINGMKPNGVLIYNGDEPLLQERVNQHPDLQSVTFGLNDHDDFFASEMDMSPVQTTFQTNQSDRRFSIPLTGRYNVANALAAIAVGRQLAIDYDQIALGLQHAPITENRTEWVDGSFGGKILSDVYNSNPTAAKEVLNFFTEVPTDGDHVVVLGDMLELGSVGPKLHASLADSLDPQRIQRVYLVGDIIKALAEQLADKYPADRVKLYANDEKSALVSELKAVLTRDDMLLLKASHGIHLEEVLREIIER
ncbi:possible UDP-N-acetylmuramoyl-tripeptide--D-alanyl-D-alanine ligase [Weissella oryzae SG25]|uniref:UDP-N-acetylmuramoyl-tripeptide--D-alanyl-D-alanine ligase n=1 Tax=Weissella oryzae (strain DSM 25784 / JCM 18191 / LMG 30913 / SG25) TaxID=1329250 RepID=A0A069CWM7_WEIOS|nr:possible UDP-N-acetylmuramoyl-tripeptide--D-alanyl-D-alanine ligase [Weissella oryzae SG25]